MGRNRRGRAPLASLFVGLMVLAQVAWVPGGTCLRGASGHGGATAGAASPATGADAGILAQHAGHGAVHGASGPAAPDDSGAHGDPHGSHEGCDCALSCLACGACGVSLFPDARGSAERFAQASPSSALSPEPVGLQSLLRTPHILPFPNGPPLRS